jgi:hypothetical protein
VIELLLQDDRVDPTALHRVNNSRVVRNGQLGHNDGILTAAMLPRLTATLTLPFPDDSVISGWQPRLRRYRHDHMQFLNAISASSHKWPGGFGLPREVVEDIVAPYALGGVRGTRMTLPQYRAMDAGYDRLPASVGDLTGVQQQLWATEAELEVVQAEVAEMRAAAAVAKQKSEEKDEVVAVMQQQLRQLMHSYND